MFMSICVAKWKALVTYKHEDTRTIART